MTTQTFNVQAASQGYQNAQLAFTGSASAGGSDVSYSVGPSSPYAMPGLWPQRTTRAPL